MGPRKPTRSASKKTYDVRKIVRTGVTWKSLLQEALDFFTSHSNDESGNSLYGGMGIELDEVELWEPFITLEDVEALWEGHPLLNEALEEEVDLDDLRRVGLKDPVFGAVVDEIDFEVLWRSTVHPRINLLNKLFSKFLKPMRPEQTADNDQFIMMGGGSSARWLSPNAEPAATDPRKTKKPDHSGFLFLGDKSQFRPNNAKTVFNRIPGDAKLFRKIRRSWFPPDGEIYRQRKKVRHEAQKVLDQIHGYMDMHESRYGYVVNDQELIFFRRRPGKWGQIDIGPAIRHDVKPNRATGAMNSLYVLFYFHWKVANDDGPEGWRLESYGKHADTEGNHVPSLLNVQTRAITKSVNADRKRVSVTKGVKTAERMRAVKRPGAQSRSTR